MRPTSVLLATRIAPPWLRPVDVLPREPLLAKLDRALDVMVSVVAAPAGYGKSTALGEWYRRLGQRQIRAAWLTVDDSDNDPVVFASHMVATIDRNIPELRGDAQTMIEFRADIDLRATAAALVNAIEALAQPVVLIVDDLHEITNAEVMGLFGLLANAGSQFLHLVVSSRTQPAMRIAKLRALGGVAEFSTSDLRFSREEVRHFLADNAQDSIADGFIDEVLQRTEGWAIGLKLAALSFRFPERPPLSMVSSSLAASASSQDVGAFLRDEVLSRLPEATADFVVDAAIIGEFSAELCDHVLERRDSARMIDQLETLHLFVSRLGELGWFRFHQLFADAAVAANARKAPDRAAELHQRAAEWFVARGFSDRAARHAFATGNPRVLVEMLDRVSMALVQSGRGATVVRYAAGLPRELLDDYPALLLEQVYSLTLSWNFSEATRMLHDVRASLMNGQRLETWRARGLDVDRVLRKKVYCEMQLAILKDEMVEAEALARQWLSMAGVYTAYDDAVTQTSLLYAQREQFNCRAIATSSQARGTFVDHGNRWGSIWHDCIIGAGYSQLGQLERARTIFEDALSTAVEVVGRTNPTAAMPALHLSEVLYEFNDLDRAHALVEEFLPLASQNGLVDQLVSGYLTKVRLAALESVSAALRVLDAGEEIAISRNFARLNAFLVASRVQILALAGEAAEVRRIGTLNNLSNMVERFLPTRGMTTVAAARGFTAALIAQTENNLAGAELLLGRWMRYLSDHGYARLGVRFAVQLAHVQIVMGEGKSAHRTLRGALQLGVKGGFLRSFIDANPAVRTHLQQMQLSPIGADAMLVNYHAGILGTMGADGSRPGAVDVDLAALGGQYDALNDRESELLVMISTGLMNSQIADETGLTLGTVKWYLQQIYAKLGVNRRSEAVFKARRLGLIS